MIKTVEFNIKIHGGAIMKSETLKLAVAGMMCGHCKNAVEKGVRELEGMIEANVDLEGGLLTVTFDSEQDGESEIRAAVEKAGYQVTGRA